VLTTTTVTPTNFWKSWNFDYLRAGTKCAQTEMFLSGDRINSSVSQFL